MIDTVTAWIKSLDKNDAQLIVSSFVSALVTFIVWWAFFGRKRYSTRGMR